MNRTLTFLLAAACLAPAARAGEKRLTEKQMPAPVLAAFHKTYPGAAIRGLAVETEHGQTTYEIESLDGKTRRDLSYLADGTLAEVEETIPESDLPAAVLAAVKAKHPKAKLLKAEKDTKGAAVTYELHINEGKRRREVVLTPEGKTLNEEAGGKD
ncbi:MAG TPA: PepSY-like domain-containing protein [Holophagaceae bacterium]|nr:PepSY-like domain-containing protein [Holophagaceae bacterium]